jgi:hypothetical protein
VYEEGAKKREREREREIRPGQEELLEEVRPCGNAKRGQEEEEEAEVTRSKPRVWPSPCGSDASRTLLTTEKKQQASQTANPFLLLLLLLLRLLLLLLLKTHLIRSEWRTTTTMLIRNHCRNSCLQHDFSYRKKTFLAYGWSKKSSTGGRSRARESRERRRARASERASVESAERTVELAIEWAEWVELAEICLEFGF